MLSPAPFALLLAKLCIVLCLVFTLRIAVAEDPKVPESFLPATGRLLDALNTPVNGAYRATPAPEVIAALCRQFPANCVYRGNTKGQPPPTFTGTFKDTPFRTALFQIAQATHITIEWTERPDGGKLISASE